MATRRNARRPGKAVTDYEHTDATRLNNPPAGLAREDLAPPPTRSFATTPVDDDPRVPPELVWWGKADSDAFEVEAPSIHIHEALTTEAIIAAARRESAQPALFADPALDRSQQVAFYQHEGRWRNRLVLGDSLTAMASLLERERLGGQVQMIYIDPPYGISFNSNFQALISQRAPKEGSDDAITRAPEQIQAYRDTWVKGVHSYLTYLRERLLAARELLAPSGCVFVQIGPENVHRVRMLLDEVFGDESFVGQITVMTTSGTSSPSGRTSVLSDTCDYLLWYARDLPSIKYRPIYVDQAATQKLDPNFAHVELPGGERRRLRPAEKADPSLLPVGSRIYRLSDATSQKPTTVYPFELDGKLFTPGSRGWRTTEQGMRRLHEKRRLVGVGKSLMYVQFADDFPFAPISNVWTDLRRSGFSGRRRFVVETLDRVIARCLLMTTDPGDLVFDPTCGSGTTAFVAEQYGRRWITTDTSRVAIALARERVLTASFPMYRLTDPDRGVDGGLELEAASRVTLRSLAYDDEPERVALVDQPVIDPGIVRVSGPFTVEALSRYAANPFLDEATAEDEAASPDAAEGHVVALLDALRSMGIPRRGSEPAKVTSLQRVSGTGALHAEGTYASDTAGERQFGVSLGPRHGPITVQQIDEALSDAYGYELVVFAGFTATAEAQEYLRGGRRGRFEVALLEANADLLLGDLLKNTRSSQTFRLFSAPEVKVRAEADGQVFVELLGMDTYDAATGEVVSRDQTEIAAWFVDHAYDGLVFHVNQAFFTRSNAWEALGKALKDTIDADVVAAMHSFVSLPFAPGDSGRIAVRVVDDAGQTSEAVIPVERG